MAPSGSLEICSSNRLVGYSHAYHCHRASCIQIFAVRRFVISVQIKDEAKIFIESLTSHSELEFKFYFIYAKLNLPL